MSFALTVRFLSTLGWAPAEAEDERLIRLKVDELVAKFGRQVDDEPHSYVCMSCGSRVKRMQKLRRHMREVHLGIARRKPDRGSYFDSLIL